MKHYEGYQSTDLKWVRSIPAHWDVKRLKSIFQIRKEKNDPVITKNILSLTAKQGVVPYAQKEDKGGNKPKENLTDYFIAREGDLLVNCMNIVSGAAGVSKYFGAVSPVYYPLFPRNDENVWYYHHVFRLITFQRSLVGLGKGILMHESDNGTLTTVRKRISMDSLGNVLLPLPPRDEQDQIVRFLDWKISAINKLIAHKKEQIKMLKTQKQVAIDNNVFREYAPIFKSGDTNSRDFDFPANWKVVKLNGYFNFYKGLSITKKDLIDEGISVISYGQVHSKLNTGTEINNSLIRFVDEDYLQTSASSLVQKGDFIFADTSEDFEGVGNCVFVDRNDPIFAGYHTIVARSKDGMVNRYLAYLFKSSFWRFQLRKNVNGVKVYSITQKILKKTFVILPPSEIQEEIVQLLDNICNKLASTIAKILEEITVLAEFKNKLISDVVTGQIDVRNIKVPEYEFVDETFDSEEADDGENDTEEASE